MEYLDETAQECVSDQDGMSHTKNQFLSYFSLIIFFSTLSLCVPQLGNLVEYLDETL